MWARVLVQDKVLKENNSWFVLWKRSFAKSNNESYTRIKTLEKEEKDLQSKYEGHEKVVLKFSKGQDNLDKLLGSQMMSFNKEGIGYNPFKKKKTYENFFVQETSKNKPYIIWNRCLTKGHISYSCPLRKSNVKIIQVRVSKGTWPQNMITTNVGPKFVVKARKVWSIIL